MNRSRAAVACQSLSNPSRSLSAQISCARRAASRIWFNVAFGSCALINRQRFTTHGGFDVFVQSRAKIHFAPNDTRQFFTIIEITETHAFQRARLEFGQHVHVAALRVKKTTQNPTQKREVWEGGARGG